MKLLLLIFALACCIFECHSECDRTCMDLMRGCSYMKLFSGGCSQYKIFCRRTCSNCIPCTPKVDCKDCVDKRSDCAAYKLMNQCRLIKNQCPLTCGSCTPCKPTATPPPPCDEVCEDVYPRCSLYKQRNQCKNKQYEDWMKTNCAKTCGTCKLCPSTAIKLPPPKPTECTTGICINKNDNCDYWAKEGFCNDTKNYPQLENICMKSCNICVKCEEGHGLPPPPPPSNARSDLKQEKMVQCTNDCKEDPTLSKDCAFWKKQGFCSPTSENFNTVGIDCKITCGICIPCKIKA